ncbi:MAG: Rv3235 family protein [Nakamurella sp.]
MTTALTTAPSRPATMKPARGIALVAVPDTEPPFDDELTAAARVRKLRSLPARDPDVSAPVGTLRAASTSAGPLVASPVPDLSYAADIGVRHTPTDRLPSVRQTAATLARALAEVLTGARPANQLQNHCTPTVFAGLVKRTPLPGQGLARLQSAHVSQPADGVAEVAAVFRRGPRGRALAFQLTGLDGRWRITALQVG